MSYIGSTPPPEFTEVAADSVETGDIKNSAVTTAKIADGAVTAAKLASGAAVPSQTGQSGKFLTTDGSVASWATVEALPTQTGNAGKYLRTDGSTASWQDAATVGAVITNSNSISANYTLPTNFNGLSVGPINIASGVTVTVPSGQRWVVI